MVKTKRVCVKKSKMQTGGQKSKGRQSRGGGWFSDIKQSAKNMATNLGNAGAEAVKNVATDIKKGVQQGLANQQSVPSQPGQARATRVTRANVVPAPVSVPAPVPVPVPVSVPASVPVPVSVPASVNAGEKARIAREPYSTKRNRRDVLQRKFNVAKANADKAAKQMPYNAGAATNADKNKELARAALYADVDKYGDEHTWDKMAGLRGGKKKKSRKRGRKASCRRSSKGGRSKRRTKKKRRCRRR